MVRTLGLDRRSLLLGLLAGGLLAPVAARADDGLRARAIRAARALRSRIERRVAVPSAAIGRWLDALEGLAFGVRLRDEVAALPPAAQREAVPQELLAEAAETTARSARRLADALRALPRETGHRLDALADADPAAWDWVGAELADAVGLDLDDGAWRRARPSAGLGRFIRRVERAERAAADLVDRGDDRAVRAWNGERPLAASLPAEPPPLPEVRRRQRRQRVAGGLLLGLSVLTGAVFVWTMPILLAAGVLGATGIAASLLAVGVVAVVALAAGLPLLVAGLVEPGEPARFEVDPRGGWLTTGLQLLPGQSVVLVARGDVAYAGVQLPLGGMSTPAGGDAPAPGAPRGALLARIGNRVHLVGERLLLPVDRPGVLQLAINLGREDHPEVDGLLEVIVRR